MSHEINENVNKKNEQPKGDAGLNLLDINENDTKSIEATQKALEINEKDIAAVMQRIADLAKRCCGLGSSDEPHHFQTMKDTAEKGAAAGEPAYIELKKHLK